MEKSDFSYYTKGIVVFYEIINPNADGDKPYITEMGYTEDMPAFDALEVYANTHNPASQLLYFNTYPEKLKLLSELRKNATDPLWLEQLFNYI